MARRKFRRGLFDPGVGDGQLSFPEPPEEKGAESDGASRTPAGDAAAAAGRKVYSVGEITTLVKGTIERTFGPLWIEGEISNLSRPPSGHRYFTLKDEAAQIQAILFREAAYHAVGFELADGLRVLVHGRLAVYAPRGQYQIIVDRVEPLGAGRFAVEFERLKRQLAAEGLFDPARKRPLPGFPRTVGIVTSPTGAAVRDMLELLRSRWPPLRVILAPVRVQGAGAAEEIAAGLAALTPAAGAPRGGEIDVVIVGRGGGERRGPRLLQRGARRAGDSRLAPPGRLGRGARGRLLDLRLRR